MIGKKGKPFYENHRQAQRWAYLRKLDREMVVEDRKPLPDQETFDIDGPPTEEELTYAASCKGMYGSFLNFALNGVNEAFVKELASQIPPEKKERNHKGEYKDSEGWRDSWDGNGHMWLFD